METWLNVAEKPSVAKEVSSVLSRGSARSAQTLSRMNPVTEFQWRNGTGPEVKMIFTSVLGHLMEEEFPSSTKSWSSYPFASLFTVPMTKQVNSKLEAVERNLKQLARKATHLVLWLDCDREGENICFEVMHVVQSVNPRVQVKRAHFSALTPRDLFHAVSHLGVPDRGASEAVDARQEMDLRIGAAFTRFQTVMFRDEFIDPVTKGMPQYLSFGPCQFPCLGFVVERHLVRENFVSERHASVILQHRIEQPDSTREVTWSWDRGQVYDMNVAVSLYEECVEEANNDDAHVEILVVQQKPKKRGAPAPLATVELQKLAARLLHISSERCMTLAESLYQAGYVSYPRTETDVFTFTDPELKELAAQHQQDRRWGAYAQSIATTDRFRRPKNGGHNDNAHPPIHPTKPYDGEQSDQASLYELIVRHFLASMSPDAVAADTQVKGTFSGEGFHCGGHTVVEKGWYEIWTYERWNNTDVPNYQQGERFKPHAILLREGSTEPPPNLSEAQLITSMDKNGIGTDATIASHIKTILDRKYATNQGGIFFPTPLGLALVVSYERIGLRDLCEPLLRAQFELGMADVARGTVSKEQFLQAAVRKYTALLEKAMREKDSMKAQLGQFLLPVTGGGDGRGGEVLQFRSIRSDIGRCGRCGDPSSLRLETGSSTSPVPNAPTPHFVSCGKCTVRFRVPFPQRAKEIVPLDNTCVLCGFSCFSVNMEAGYSFPFCPHCSANPPEDYNVRTRLGDLESLQQNTEFRCQHCTAQCPLAQGFDQVSLKSCPHCRAGSLRLKRKTAGSGLSGYFVACNSYPACQYSMSLPSCERAVPVLTPAQHCACGSRLVEIVFSLGQAPPMMDPMETVCVFCDGRLEGFTSVRGAPPATAARGGTSALPVSSSAPSNFVPSAANDDGYVLPEVQPRARGRGSGRGRGRARGGRGGGGAQTGNGNVMCNCNVPAKEFVSKQTVSSGRRFLTCGNNRTCNFFEWLDS